MQTLRVPELPSASPPASLLRWLTKPGATVRKGQALALLDQGKSLVCIESPWAGTVGSLHAQPHETLAPGADLLDLDTKERAESEPSASKTPEESAMPQTPSSTPQSDPRVTPLLLPQVGNSMEEGTILKWHVQIGDRIQPGQVLYEVETDKATVEIESEQEGRIARIVIDENQTTEVKTPVAYLAEEDSDVDAYLSQAGQAPDAKESAPEAAVNAESPDDQPSGPSGAVAPILMPQVGNSMEEGTIVKWHVACGDRVEKGQVIFEVETDKAVVEVEADEGGRLARIVLEEGGTLAVKQPVAYLAENDGDVDAYLSTAGAQAAFEQVAPSRDTSAPLAPEIQAPAKPLGSEKTPSPGKPSTTSPARAKASPAARRMAREAGIDLGSLPAGSGPGGRILSTDLPEQAPAAEASVPQGLGREQRNGLGRMRKAIGSALQASKQNIPHFYMRTTVLADAMMDFYRDRKQKFPLSLNDVVTKAVGVALAEFPAFRSRIEGDEIVTAGTVNVGIAVGMDEGLVVPVVQGVENLSLEQLATRVRDLVDQARKGKVQGMGTGCLTISNLGMFGVEEFSAIINPPESAILAVGAAREEVIVENGALRPGRKMTMTLSCDHRVVDGLAAARFSARLKEILEAPQGLLD
jgi:pyruvate dehydrogenase E2 component (dihydrolipoamide acetyltransferase)